VGRGGHLAYVAMQHGDAQPTVLVVDHDVWERKYTSDTLENEGYAVMAASNGASALRLAEQFTCDAILLDIALPEMNGLELMRVLKDMDRTSAIPVIVLGQSTAESVAVAGCVPKPLDGVRMISEVARCLQAVPPTPRH